LFIRENEPLSTLFLTKLPLEFSSRTNMFFATASRDSVNNLNSM
jgi:hypothetical protein